MIIISETVLNSTQITAIAIPMDTLPCSNSLTMKVDTTKVLGGDIMLEATNSRKEIIKVNNQAVRTPLEIKGSVMRRKI